MKTKAQLACPSNLPGVCARCKDPSRRLYCRGLCNSCYHKNMRRLAKDKRFRVLDNRPKIGSPAWVEDWLKQQIRNFTKKNNIPQEWESLFLVLCQIVYVAADRHRGHKGEGPRLGTHQKKAWWDQKEEDGEYMDYHLALKEFR